MSVGDIIILGVYIVGFFITFFYQKNKIGALKTQVDSQSGTISSMQRLVDLYDIDKIEKFVKLSEKTVLLEKKEEIEEVKKEAKSKIVRIVKKMIEANQITKEEIIQFAKLNFYVGYKSANIPNLEKTVEKMKDGFEKEVVLDMLSLSKKGLEEVDFDLESFQFIIKEKDTENQKQSEEKKEELS